MLSKREPFEYRISVIPGEVINCQIKVKANKKNIGKTINACIHITYKTDYLGRGNSTNVACSDVGTMVLDERGCNGEIVSVSLVAPDFRITNAIKSVVYFYTESYTGIDIAQVNVVKIRDTVVEIKGEEGIKSDSIVPESSSEIGKGIGGPNVVSIRELIKVKFQTSGKIDVICEGLMLGNSGFAKAMRNVTYGLDSVGEGRINVKSVILDGDSIGCSKTDVGKRIIVLSNNHSVSGGNGVFYISMNFPLGVTYHAGFYNIAYIMFETVDFPSAFVDHVNSNKIDEIWTPSSFCKESMERAGLKNVRVMPLGVDTNLFNRETADAPRYIPGNLGGILSGKFKFLTTMGYSERKGVSILIKAFVEEFGLGNGGADVEKVALYFKGGWYDINKAKADISKITYTMKNVPYIHLDFNIYPDDVLVSLFKACDCFVLPSRGEGFGLPMCEAMSIGLPTIGTRWSGNLEFMNDDNSYLINVDGFAEEPRCNWVTGYYKNQKFASPSLDHLKQLMRYVFEHREEAIEKGKVAREYIVQNFDWKVSCAKMRNRLEEIARGE